MAQSIRALRSERTRTEESWPNHPSNSIQVSLERRIIRLKQRHPSWGARRIKYQYDLPCHWEDRSPSHQASRDARQDQGEARSPRSDSSDTTSTRCGKDTHSSSGYLASGRST